VDTDYLSIGRFWNVRRISGNGFIGIECDSATPPTDEEMDWLWARVMPDKPLRSPPETAPATTTSASGQD
jgi:hypothetical protein